MNLQPIPAFNDNYIWMIDNGVAAWVVDPGDPQPVLDHLEQCALTLAGILVTHHHFDHVGGLKTLRQHTGCRIVGPNNPNIDGIEEPVGNDALVTVLDAEFRVIAVPGHTLDHISFYSAAENLLFCGDTLFAGGCGRLFEGTAEMMHASLSRLAALPGATRVCCAHEYTLANLDFARAVEPDNEALTARQAHCQQLRADGLPTLPSDIATERATNPFLRVETPAVLATLQNSLRLEGTGPSEAFAALRRWKDEY